MDWEKSERDDLYQSISDRSIDRSDIGNVGCKPRDVALLTGGPTPFAGAYVRALACGTRAYDRVSCAVAEHTSDVRNRTQRNSQQACMRDTNECMHANLSYYSREAEVTSRVCVSIEQSAVYRSVLTSPLRKQRSRT
jgi:hypothetical protein